MKAFNNYGCIIEGITEEEFNKLKKVGWMNEEEYKIHLSKEQK